MFGVVDTKILLDAAAIVETTPETVSVYALALTADVK